jgi:hypothetical protein
VTSGCGFIFPDAAATRESQGAATHRFIFLNVAATSRGPGSGDTSRGLCSDRQVCEERRRMDQAVEESFFDFFSFFLSA